MFEGDINFYVYAGNDPINAADPDGRFWQYLPCLYYQWKYGELLKECSCEAEESCEGDKFFTQECQGGSGGFYGTKVLRCIERKDPGALASLVSWCGAAGSAGARSRTGGIPMSKR